MGSPVFKGQVFDWHKCYSKWQKNAHVNSWSDWPTTVKTDGYAEKVQKFVCFSQRVTIRMIGEGMGMDKHLFCQILIISLEKYLC